MTQPDPPPLKRILSAYDLGASDGAWGRDDELSHQQIVRILNRLFCEDHTVTSAEALEIVKHAAWTFLDHCQKLGDAPAVVANDLQQLSLAIARYVAIRQPTRPPREDQVLAEE